MDEKILVILVDIIMVIYKCYLKYTWLKIVGIKYFSLPLNIYNKLVSE